MSSPRRPTNTEIAIDDVVGSAADEVERRLKAEGLAQPCVTPRDVLRSRYPNDSIDDEAITEQLSDPPFAVARARSLRTPTPISHGASSLSPISLRTPPPFPAEAKRPTTHARRVAAQGGAVPRGRTRTFFSRAPSGAWIVALITLGGVTAFTAVMASRTSSFLGPVAAPPRAAARSTTAPPLGEAEPSTTAAAIPRATTADAGAALPSPAPVSPIVRPRAGRPSGR